MSEVAGTASMRASALLELGRPREAEQLVRAALQSEPSDASLLTALARALLDQDRYPEARAAADSAVAAEPKNAMALSCVAAAAAGQSRYSDALTAVQRAVELAPAVADLHRQHAEVLLAKKRSSEALAAARHARQLAPQSATIAAALGEILLATGEAEQARVEIDRALRLDPESARAHRAAGRLGLQHGGGIESVQRYREALRLDPTDAAARRGLATALKSRNPIYRRVLLFELWLASLPKVQRWATVVGPLIIIRIIDAASHGPIATGLSALFLIFVAISWGADPVCNLTLLTNRLDRALLTTGQRRAALAFTGFAALAVGSFIGAYQTKWLIPYGFGFALWALVSGAIHSLRRPALTRVLVLIGFTAVTAGIAGLTCLGLGIHNGSVAASVVLMISAIPAWWITALAR